MDPAHAWLDDHHVQLLSASDENITVSRVSRSRRDGDKTFLDMHHLIGSRDGIEHDVDVHEMTLFRSEQYEQSLQRAGFISVESIASPWPGQDRYIGVVGSS
jgi:dTDP-3-amino-3,6-dideoxy-alpha-D-glucopyranose N,N-dimethyltransferase